MVRITGSVLHCIATCQRLVKVCQFKELDTLYGNSSNWTLITWNEQIIGSSMNFLDSLYEAMKMNNNSDFMKFN